MQFEEAISLDLDNKHSSDETHHSLELFKESLIRDFLVQVNVIMQPRFAIQLGESIYTKSPADLPSPRH
jgi:hypothetical protein